MGIDVSPLSLSRAGTARHLVNLLAAIEAEGAVELRRYSFPGTSRGRKVVRDTAWYLGALPHRARRDQVDVLHCATVRAPVRSTVPLVVTVHDLAILRHPETFNRWTRLYTRALLPHVTRAADRLVAVSEFTGRELRALLGVPAEKIRVIPNGVGPPFSPEGGKAGGEYVLAVATREPRKNLERVVEGFRRASLNGVELRVVGARGWGEVHVGGEGVRVLGFVDDDELARLYRGARCVAYPSLYEGFGLPVLEAMACGAAVVAPGGDPYREFADGVTVEVEPREAGSIAEGLREAIERREELGALGARRAKEFTWARTARATIDVYREVAA